MKELAAVLYNLRIAKGLSQQECSQLLSIPQSMIAKLETGRHGITSKTMLRYCEAFDLRIELVPKTKNSNPIWDGKQVKRQIKKVVAILNNVIH